MLRTHLHIAILTIATLSAASPTLAFTFNDITSWTGAGSNESALVIDWGDGSTPLVWGYRWNGSPGSASGADMFNAIANADARLFLYAGDTATANTAGDTTGGANSVYGIGYDNDNDGFALTPGAGDTGSATDGDDRYAEGWFSAGFWGTYVNIDNNEFDWGPPVVENPNFNTQLGNPYDGGTWGFSGLGFQDTALFNGSWDGYAYQPGFAGSEPGTPVAAATPEPVSLMILTVAGSALFLRRRINH